MRFSASAPGKAVLLGEYAVLDGARALVMAVDRRCRAEIAPAEAPVCRLKTLMPAAAEREFAPGRPSGVALVDALIEAARMALPWPAWTASIDSSEFFVQDRKLGLGSSAAALVAFAGVWWAAAERPDPPGLHDLIRAHRTFQGGAGSGIDVAAALLGGAVEFRLDPGANPEIGSVQLPKSVGFAGIFAGGSASTPGLVGQYRRFAEARPAEAAAQRQRMSAVADEGCAAARERDGAAFVAAIAEYGHCLLALGEAIGADIVTSAHRVIGSLAGDFDLAYKVSGAGGGDLGIACGLDAGALAAFSAAAAERGFEVIPLAVGEQGLTVEEHAE
jgi:phosphomevalonate kinase